MFFHVSILIKVVRPHCLYSEVGNVKLDVLVSNVMQDTDAWSDADMESVITYLRGNRHLNVPCELRKVLGMDK